MINKDGTVVVGQKGKAGRKKLSEELIKKAKERVYLDVLKEMLPDKLLAEKHLELLTTPKKIRTYIKGGLENKTEELDVNAIKSGLDMAYKLRGDYAEQKIKHSGEIEFKAITGMKIQIDGADIQDENKTTG